uniref:C2H2-type domain-containing protein n=1 Tax=Eptatretus burgeri TaxID=7764 RepID=A0A8C4X173_EPTBU
MSVMSGAAGAEQGNAVDAYDSGDDWEIGVGDLIIDLDADLEKDRQKLEQSAAGTRGKEAPVGPGGARPAAEVPAGMKLPAAPGEGAERAGKSKMKRNKSGKSGAGPKKAEARVTNPAGANVTTCGRQGKATRTAGTKRDKCKAQAGQAQGAAVRTSHGGVSTASTARTTLQATLVVLQQQRGHGAHEEGRGEEPRAAKKVKTEKVNPAHSSPSSLPLGMLTSQPPCPSALVEAEPEEQILIRTRTVGVSTCEASTLTDAECLGPCEPGTCVNLEGIVWHESESLLVVNVTWRNKTYVGTLLDCSKHEWAPPRFCESPTSDVEMRGGRGRGKKARAASSASQTDPGGLTDGRGPPGKGRGMSGAGSNKGRRGSLSANGHWGTLHSAASSDDMKASPNGKRKGRPATEISSLHQAPEDSRAYKRLRPSPRTISGQASSTTRSDIILARQDAGSPEGYRTPNTVASPIFIDCPHPNCSKKYRHINGLKYHQAHAHLKTDGNQQTQQDNDNKNADEECNSLGNIISNQTETINEASSSLIKEEVSKMNGDTDLSEEPIVASPSHEMPLLEAETPAKEMDGEKLRKVASLKVLPKAKNNRLIAPAPPPPPPQLVAMPGMSLTSSATTISSSLGLPATPVISTVIKAMPKSPPLKPIQPKPASTAESVQVCPNLVPIKEKKKKDKKRSKDRESKETVSLKLSLKVIGRTEENSDSGKELSSLLSKDYVVKNENVSNSPSESPEKRIASIKAEAAKVYNFTDNSPSPSIGSGYREVPRVTLINGRPVPQQNALHNGIDGLAAPNNESPAYSDISDDGEELERERERERVKKVFPTKVLSFNDSELTTLDTRAIQNEEDPSLYSEYNSYFLQPKLQQDSGNVTESILHQTATPTKDPDDGLVNGGVNGPIGDSDLQSLLVTQQNAALSPRSLYYQQYPFGYNYYEQHYRSQPPGSPSGELAMSKHCDRKSKHRNKDISRSGDGKKKSIPLIATSAPQTPVNQEQGKVTMLETLKSGHAFSNEAQSQQEQEESGSVRQTPSHLLASIDKTRQDGGDQVEPKLSVMLQTHGSVCLPAFLQSLQEFDVNQWQQMYYAQFMEQQRAEEECWKKLENRQKVDAGRDVQGNESDGKAEAWDAKRPQSKPTLDTNEDKTDEGKVGAGNDSQSSVHVTAAAASSFLQYMSQNPYAQLYDPNHPAFRGVSPMMMHFYAGGYISPSLYYSAYGKLSGQEDGEVERQCQGGAPVWGNAGPEPKTSDPQQNKHSACVRLESTAPSSRTQHPALHPGVSYHNLNSQYEHYQGNALMQITSKTFFLSHFMIQKMGEWKLGSLGGGWGSRGLEGQQNIYIYLLLFSCLSA